MARDTSAADYSRMKLDEDPAAYIRAHTMGGHTYESHVGVSDETLLDNVLAGKKRGDTAYKDAETEIYCTSELLYANMDRIIAFAEGTSSKDKGSRIVLQSDFYDPDTGEPSEIGTGFISEASSKYQTMTRGAGVHRVSCACAAVVITKNRNIPGGWEITTSFPMAYPPDFMEPCKDLSGSFEKTLVKTRTYATSSPTLRAYMDYACSGKPRNRDLTVEYLPEDRDRNYPESLRISDKAGHKQFARETDAPRGLRRTGPGSQGVDGLADSMSRRINYHKQCIRLRTEEMLRQAGRVAPSMGPCRENQKGLGE